jgi:hypothetical protein
LRRLAASKPLLNHWIELLLWDIWLNRILCGDADET